MSDKQAGWEPSPEIRKDPTQSRWIDDAAIKDLQDVWDAYKKEIIALILKHSPEEKPNMIGAGGVDVAAIIAALPLIKEKFVEEGTIVTGAMVTQAVMHGTEYATDQLIRVEELPEGAPVKTYPLTKELITTLETMDVAALTGIADELNKQIAFEIGEGLKAGEGTYAITKRVDGILDVGWRKAETLVRTEVITATTEATRQRFDKHKVALCELISCLDDRTCDDCAEMHGDVTEVDGPGFETPDGGRGWPPFHPQCRCAIAPVIPGLYDGPYCDDLQDMFPEVF